MATMRSLTGQPDAEAGETGPERFASLVTALVCERADSFGLRANVRMEESAEVPSEARGVLLFVLDEAITNAGRHGDATTVDVVVSGGGRLTVVDDGRGFNPMIRPPGRGLVCMRERAAAIGGHLSIRSMRGSGTTIEVSLA
jgi:signal transduction histidine kinase